MFDSGENLTGYLDARVDLDFVSASLSERGVKLGQLMGKKPLEPTIGPITHELVLDLEGFRKKEQLPRNWTCTWIKKLSGMTEEDSKLIRSVDKLMTCYNQVKVKSKQNPNLMSFFLATTFQTVTALNTQAAPTRSVAIEKSVVCRKEGNVQKLSKVNAVLREKSTSQEAEITMLRETVAELSKDKMELRMQVVEKEKLQLEVANLKEGMKVLKQDKNPSRTQHLKNNAKKWKDSARSLQHAHIRLLEVKKELKMVKAKALAAKCNLQRDVRRARSRIALLTEANDQLKKEIQELQLAAQTDIPQLQTRGANNRFSDDMRCTVLQLQGSANVPATQCARVIQIVAKTLFGVDICQRDLPCTQTAVNIADEGLVLAHCQAAEKMLHATNITLHCDGTS